MVEYWWTVKTKPQNSFWIISQAEGMVCSRPSVISLLFWPTAHKGEAVGWVGNIIEGSSTTITTPFMKFTDLERITIMSDGYSWFSVFQVTYRYFSLFISFNFKNILWSRCYYHHYSHFTGKEIMDQSQIASKYCKQDSKPSCLAPKPYSLSFITMAFTKYSSLT